jgi:hypothetical protein
MVLAVVDELRCARLTSGAGVRNPDGGQVEKAARPPELPVRKLSPTQIEVRR